MHTLPDQLTAAMSGAPWSLLLERVLGKARIVPTMLTQDEQLLYYWLTAMWSENAGEIVDLGCFAGGSTARLAQGHRARGLTSGIHAFDRFTAGEAVKEGLLYKNGVDRFDGTDILPLARKMLAPWGPHIHFHSGEIDQAKWLGKPVEILIMDASKTAPTMDRMADIFFPHLVSGRALVVQQDFLHWCQPWVPIQMELLGDHFVPVAHAPRDTVVFLCKKPPDQQALLAARCADLDDSAMLGYLETARDRFTPWGLNGRIDNMIDELRANPGKRKAFQFRRTIN